MTGRQYIPEVDGLRAFAVCAVVGFHYFPEHFPGGFVGVDVFFVISGFVISRAFLDPLISGRLCLLDFYVRRVRRLAPAYALVLGVTTVAAAVVLEPKLLEKFGGALAAQGAYVQNVVFWVQGDYFEAAHTKPLLHTWSLAIEEQFYLLMGLLVVLGRWRRALLAPALVLAALASLATGVVAADLSPKTAFYLLPFRIWEFCVGLAAYAVCQKLAPAAGGRWSQLGFVAGLAGLLAATFGFDHAARFPGGHTYLASAATFGLLVLFERRPQALYAPLRSPPARYLGRISYSLYLWHWPPLALYRVATGEMPSTATALLAIASCVALADQTFRRVEDPIRMRRRLAGRRTMAGLFAAFSLGCFTVGALIRTPGGGLFLSPEPQRFLLEAARERSPRRCGILYRVLRPKRETCLRNGVSATSAPAVLVMGDSHADQLDEMIGELGATIGAPVLITARSCRMDEYGHSRPCRAAVRDRILEEAKAHGVRTIVSSSMWTGRLDYARFEENVEAFTRHGMRVVLSEVVPMSAFFDPALAARALRNPSVARPAEYARAEYERLVAGQREIFRRLEARFGDQVTIVRPAERLCDAVRCRFATEDGRPHYFDRVHLTRAGVAAVRPLYEVALGAAPAP